MYSKLKLTLSDHKRNHWIISVIYISCSLISMFLSTITTFILGSKSISDITDKLSLASFLMNLISTILLSTINFLQLETKISKHHHTIKEIEDLFINYNITTINSNNELIQEKVSMINDHRPSICF